MIQFARRPPRFSSVPFTLVAGKVTHVLLAKDAIEPIPPAKMKVRFLQPVLQSTHKEWGVMTNLGSVCLEDAHA